MEPLLEQHFLIDLADVSLSAAALFEQGLQHVQQGCWSEARRFFELTCNELAPQQAHIAACIDLFLQSYRHYEQAQHVLAEASKSYVKAENELHAQALLLRQQTMSIISSSPVPPGVQTTTTRQNEKIAQALYRERGGLMHLSVTCFGTFEVRRGDQVLALCHNRSGQTILRYLVTQPGRRASVDALIDALWTEEAPEVGQRKLQVAISALRGSLNAGYQCDPGGGYILCKNRIYQLNPAAMIYTDIDEFSSLWQTGRQCREDEAIPFYEKACNLRSGPFLAEDLYANWSLMQRERLDRMYLTMCHALASYYTKFERYEDATRWIYIIFKENRCDEEAHRQLIRIYLAEGRRSEAWRQYQLCLRLLKEELNVSPMPETMKLFQ